MNRSLLAIRLGPPDSCDELQYQSHEPLLFDRKPGLRNNLSPFELRNESRMKKLKRLRLGFLCSGSPTWTRTRDLRINSSVFWVMNRQPDDWTGFADH